MNIYIKGLTLVLGVAIASLTILPGSAAEREIIGIPSSETDESGEARLLSAFFGKRRHVAVSPSPLILFSLTAFPASLPATGPDRTTDR